MTKRTRYGLAVAQSYGLSIAESLSYLRQRLRHDYPDTRFFCVMLKGTKYGDVTVRWTGGPKVHEVRKVAAIFCRHFDSVFEGIFLIKLDTGCVSLRSSIRNVYIRRRKQENKR